MGQPILSQSMTDPGAASVPGSEWNELRAAALDDLVVPTVFCRSGVVTFANRAAVTLFGVSAAHELTGRPLLERVHPHDRGRVREHLEAATRGPESPTPHRWLRAGAEWFLAEMTSGPAVGEGEETVQLVLREVAQESTRAMLFAQSEAYFRSLTENAFDLVVVLAEDSTVLYASPSTERVSGLAGDQLVSARYTELVHPADREDFASTFRGVAADAGGKAVIRHRFPATNGRWLTVESVMRSALADPVVGGVVINSRDITEAEEARSRLEAYAAELERSNLALQEFASIASHDLQEPLRKIRAFGERLKLKSAAQLDDRGVEYVDRMQDAAERMQVLVNELLTYSRITVQRATPVLVDLGALTDVVLVDLQERIRETGGIVDVHPLPGVVGDPSQLRQLMQNLIANALKFHRPGVSPRVRLDAKELRGGKVELRVSDNGIGFAQKYCDRIFQPFERLHAREEFEGTGMGLAICRRIVERNGGAIRASSTSGEGSVFFVTLPTNEDTWVRTTYATPGRSPSS